MNPQQTFSGFAPAPPAGSNDNKTKFMFIGLGGLLLISIIIFFVSMANRGGADSLFVQTIGYHREQLRISELTEDLLVDDQNVTNHQADLRALVTSDMTSLQSAYGKDINDKQIAKLMDEDAEARFAEAVQTNNFTSEYQKTVSATMNKTVASLLELRKEVTAENRGVVDTAITNQKSLLERLDNL